MRTYHFIGAGGIGMSALAHMLLDRGDCVSGSDSKCNSYTQALEKRGAHIFLGHHAQHVPKNAIVVVSTAIAEKNPELVAAKAQSQQILHRSDLLRQLSQGKKALCVTGSHGKTTTSSMLAYALSKLGDVSYCVGGAALQLHRHGYLSASEFIVIEADESDNSFLNTDPFAAIITSSEPDHLDQHKSVDHLARSYASFIHSVDQDRLVVSSSDVFLTKCAPGAVNYALKGPSFVEVAHFKIEQSIQATVTCQNQSCHLQLNLIGQHNLENAVGVLSLMVTIGIPFEKAVEALSGFSGVKRRLEQICQIDHHVFYDDYAHHPTEVTASLKALRNAYPDSQLVVIFQAHRPSRLKFFFKEFSKCFSVADTVIVTDTFTAGEEPSLKLDQDFFSALDHPDKHAVAFENCLSKLSDLECKKCVYVTMGAGNITQLFNRSDLREQIFENVIPT